MDSKKNKLPKLIIAIGLAVAALVCLLTTVMIEPTVTEHDFAYSVTYQLNGEILTIEDVCTCKYVDAGRDRYPGERYYESSFLRNENIFYPGDYTIDQKDGYELRIVTIFSEDYLMGDGDEFYSNEIYLAAFDGMGSEYTEPEVLGIFDAKIISYELPTPIENSFVFSGFSLMHDISMAAMYAVGILTVLACLIFVKRDEEVTYKALDVVSVVVNFILSLFVIPFTLTMTWWSQIVTSTDSISYQICLCVPVIGMLAIAASLCLRRKGFTKSGFFVQFASLALLALSLLIEAIL